MLCVGIRWVNLNIYIYYCGPKPEYVCVCVCACVVCRVCVPREELTIEPCKLFVFHAKGQQLYIRAVYIWYMLYI